MATFSSIRDGLKTRLETVSGLTVYDTVPDFLDPPAVIIAPFNTLNFDSTMQRGSDTYEIPVILYIQKVDAAMAQDSLDSFLASSGGSSIKAAIEGDITLGGAAMSVRVVSATDYGEYEVSQGTSFLGVTFNIEVIG
jgi:hypothetical protein|tara:strand:+ start:2390 stop:2800 length:411 start_codon:yes stop_codon:yes gene_type:complete